MENASKFKSFIKSLEFRWSDLLFIIGFIPFAVFLIFGQLFMQYPDPNMVALKPWAIILCFITILLSWSGYIFLEWKRGVRVNKYLTIAFAFIALIGIISVLIQPANHSINMIDADGNRQLISLTISSTHYMFFIFDVFSIILLIYIGLFILPYRFKSITFIKYLGYAVIGFAFVVLLYSYITESKQYYPFFIYLFEGNVTGINYNAMVSFLIHRNACGMMLMLAILFCFINHSIEKKWWYFPIAIYFYLNMILTFCKTSLIISLILFLVYGVFVLIRTFNQYKKRNLIILIAIGAVVFVGVILAGISIISKGKYIGFIYTILHGDETSGDISHTLDSRSLIWNNTYQLINQKPGLYFFFGRGFGLMNEMLLPMNVANGDTPLTFPTHNSYLNLFAEGGILYLLAYLALLGYVVYIAIQYFKKEPDKGLALSLGMIAFTFYSLIETIHYLVYPFMFVILVAYHSSKSQEIENN